MWLNARRVLNPVTGYYKLDFKEIEKKLTHEPVEACQKDYYRIEYFRFRRLGGDIYNIEFQYSTTNQNGEYYLTTNWSNMSLTTFLSELGSGHF